MNSNSSPDKAGSICLVIGGPNAPGAVGQLRSAQSLAKRGWGVHVLCCGAVPRSAAASGIHVSRLEDLPLPGACRAPNGTPGCGEALYKSNLIRYGVEILHSAHRFDAIVFPTWLAAGFRSIQAKQAQTAFTDVRLAVRLDDVSQWAREADKRWAAPDDLFIDYCERYTFDNADIQIYPSAYMLDQARRLGWQVRPDARLAPLVAHGVNSAHEVVYVGALNEEASLHLFLETAAGLDARVPVGFISPALPASVIRRNSRAIESRLPGRRCAVLCGFDRKRTLAYLADGARLAVVCDRSEKLRPEVRDCLANGVPFLAARPRWLPGHVADGPAPTPCFFEADADDAVHRLRDGIRAWCENGALGCEKDALAEALRAPAAPVNISRRASNASPAATVAVTYYNLGKYLPETLASLAAQTFADLEVLIIDDGSTEEESLRVWTQQQRLYPRFRFIRQPNAGLGAARNRALAEASGEFFIPVDADNIAAPGMVEAFVRAMTSNPAASAMTCSFLAFQESGDIPKGKFLHQYCPTGGPHVASCFFNVYGDANAVFCTADLRAVGGFETDRSTYCHDWETFVKLARAGRRFGVVPEYLFYYRRRPDSMSAVMTKDGADVYPFVQRMLTTFFIGRDTPPDADAQMVWAALAGYFLRNEPGGCAAPQAKAPLLARLLRRVVALGNQLKGWAGKQWRSARLAVFPRREITEPATSGPAGRPAV